MVPGEAKKIKKDFDFIFDIVAKLPVRDDNPKKNQDAIAERLSINANGPSPSTILLINTLNSKDDKKCHDQFTAIINGARWHLVVGAGNSLLDLVTASFIKISEDIRKNFQGREIPLERMTNMQLHCMSASHYFTRFLKHQSAQDIEMKEEKNNRYLASPIKSKNAQENAEAIEEAYRGFPSVDAVNELIRQRAIASAASAPVSAPAPAVPPPAAIPSLPTPATLITPTLLPLIMPTLPITPIPTAPVARQLPPRKFRERPAPEMPSIFAPSAPTAPSAASSPASASTPAAPTSISHLLGAMATATVAPAASAAALASPASLSSSSSSSSSAPLETGIFASGQPSGPGPRYRKRPLQSVEALDALDREYAALCEQLERDPNDKDARGKLADNRQQRRLIHASDVKGMKEGEQLPIREMNYLFDDMKAEPIMLFNSNTNESSADMLQRLQNAQNRIKEGNPKPEDLDYEDATRVVMYSPHLKAAVMLGTNKSEATEPAVWFYLHRYEEAAPEDVVKVFARFNGRKLGNLSAGGVSANAFFIK
jgi:hypothetical protein